MSLRSTGGAAVAILADALDLGDPETSGIDAGHSMDTIPAGYASDHDCWRAPPGADGMGDTRQAVPVLPWGQVA
jgi:hypothetical protein